MDTTKGFVKEKIKFTWCCMITMHSQFVDYKNEVRIFTLALRDTENQHSSDFIQRLIEDVLKDCEISQKQVLTVVTDNDSNMTLAVQKLSEDSITLVAENEDELQGISILEEETSLAFRYNSEFKMMTHMPCAAIHCSWQYMMG